MKRVFISRFFPVLIVLSLAVTADAQLNPFKKKNKEEKAVADTLSPTENQAEEGDKKEKKKGGFFQKVVAKVAKVGSNASGSLLGTTQTTDDLDSFDPAIFLSSNLYPKSVGTMQTDFYNGWREGGDLVGVMLMPKDKLYFYKLDGTIKVNGEKADYQAAGAYTTVLDGSNAAKVLELQTKKGQTARFTLQPKQNKLKIISINSQTNKPVVDLNKDFTIQLEGFTPGSFIKVEVVMQTLSIRGQFEVGSYRAAPTVTIPGYIFKHLNSTNETKFKFVNPYILVSETEVKETRDENGNYKKPIRYFAGTSSYMAVNVINPQENTNGFTVSESGFRLEKGNAYFSPPLSMATTVAPVMMLVKGTTYYYDVSESKAIDRTITTTKEVKFPQIPDEKLDAVLSELYNQLSGILKEELNTTIIAPEKVTSVPAYALIDPYTLTDENTEEHFNRAYKGLNEIPSAAPLALMVNGVSLLFEPLQVNALLKAKLEFRISWDGKKPGITPTLQVDLLGMPNGGVCGASQPSYFFKGSMSGQRVVLSDGTVTNETINRIMQVDNFTSSFRKALQQLKEKEKGLTEYKTLWDLQR
jgi:hypothetical protein